MLRSEAPVSARESWPCGLAPAAAVALGAAGMREARVVAERPADDRVPGDRSGIAEVVTDRRRGVGERLEQGARRRIENVSLAAIRERRVVADRSDDDLVPGDRHGVAEI